MSFKLIETQYEPEVVGRAVKTMISKLNYTRFYTGRQAHSVLHWGENYTWFRTGETPGGTADRGEFGLVG